MNLSPMVPALTGLTLTALLLLASREHHHSEGEVEVFKYPSALAYLMFACALGFTGLPFLPGAQGDMHFITFASPIWTMALIAAVFGAYLRKFRIRVGHRELSIGAWRRRTIHCADITAIQVTRGNGPPQMRLSLRDGERIRISGMLTDFEALAQRMTGSRASIPLR